MMRSYSPIWITLLLLCSCKSWFTVDVTTEVEDGDESVVFDTPIPEAPAVLKTFRLSPPTIHPELRSRLSFPKDCRIAFGDPPTPQPIAATKMTNDKTRAHIAEGDNPRAGETRRCREDRDTGEVELYPDFIGARRINLGAELTLDRAQERAKALLLSAEVLPKDADEETSAVFDRQIVVHHQQALRESDGATTSLPQGKPDAFLIYSSLVRRVGDYPVDGPGSRMALAMDRDGGVQGFVRWWRVASNGEEVKARFTSAEVHAEIERQLLAIRPRRSLHVQKIEIVYYDGNGKLLQPVYRYVVEESQTRSSLGHAEHVVGYVAYAETSEGVPKLSDVDRTRHYVQHLEELRRSDLPTDPILIGAYITRNDRQDWVNDALGFIDEISASQSLRFVVTQRLPALPSMFTSESARYVNSVDLALVEAHGKPWAFATDSDCCSPVYFHRDDSGKPSNLQLGTGLPAGRLRHLVMHSCRVVASPDETQDWATPWWTVFNGLTTVVGYRTSMYINDGAGVMFGRGLAAGAPVLAAWFNSVASLNSYGRDPSLHFLCEGEQAMGRPAAISICGSEHATASYRIDSSGPAKCLDAWWISDSNALAPSQHSPN